MSKYIDSVLDRISKFGIDNLDQLDKEYLASVKNGIPDKSIEGKYELCDKLRDFVFRKREPNLNEWDFIVIDEMFLWYDKSTLELKQYGDSVWFYEWNDKIVCLNISTIKRLEEENEWDAFFLNELIRAIYFATPDGLKLSVSELIDKEKPFDGERMNGLRWVICQQTANEFVVGMGYTPEGDLDYYSCPDWFLKVKY